MFDKNELKGLIFNIERYAIHDGPGIRTIVFLKGCPLRCLWCSNPESQESEIEKIPDDDSGKRVFSKTGIIGKYYTIDEVINELKKDEVFYRHSGGGITLSGGEPLNQSEFCGELLRRCKENHLNTAIETCGYSEWKNFENVVQYTDRFLFDLKVIDQEKHMASTGVDNQLILDNFKRLSDFPVMITVRIPVIWDFNDNIELLQDIINTAEKNSRVDEIHMLPFHSFGNSKYRMLKRENKYESFESMTLQAIEAIRAKIKLPEKIEVKIII